MISEKTFINTEQCWIAAKAEPSSRSRSFFRVPFPHARPQNGIRRIAVVFGDVVVVVVVVVAVVDVVVVDVVAVVDVVVVVVVGDVRLGYPETRRRRLSP